MDDRYNDFGKFAKLWRDLHDSKEQNIRPLLVKTQLDTNYNGSGRHHHNATHIDEGLLEFDRVRNLCEEPLEVEVAWDFHDYIYDSRAKDNEEKSALSAFEILLNSGVDERRAERVRNLVLATKHIAVPNYIDAKIIIDIDLSILGKPKEVFEKYEKNIRKEYSWVEENLFRRERKKILETFLKRDSIYLTEIFRDKYEEIAQANISRSLERLS